MTEEAKKDDAPTQAPKNPSPFEQEVEALKKFQAFFQKAHDSYEKALQDFDEDGYSPSKLVPHLGDFARRELGKAEGGMTAAIQALDAFLTRDAVAKKAYAEAKASAQKAKKEAAK